MEVQKKERQSNFELMRIISMLLIIVWHIIIHSGIREGTVGAMNLAVQFIYIIISVHVNSFVLLAGYFQYNKKPSLKKALKLFNQTWFYKAVIAIIFAFFALESIPTISFVKELLPLSTIDYWFINCYLLLFLLMPYINILIEKLNQKSHRQLILILFFLFSIVALLSGNTTVQNHGSTLINFILLYIIGAYLHKYPLQENIHFKNYSHNKKQCLFFGLFLFFGFLNFLMYIFSTHLMTYDNIFLQEIGKMWSVFQTSFSNPLILIQSVFYFLYFSTLTIKNKFINKLSPYILGVYLIHENHHVYNYIYHFIGFDKIENMLSPMLFLKLILLAVVIFVVCIIIEWLRQRLFSFIEKRKSITKVRERVVKYIKSI